METLLVLVFTIGGSLWAYRQWHAVRQLGSPTPPSSHYPPAPAHAESPYVVDETANVIYPTPSKRPVSQGNSAGVNKYLVAALCVAWIVCPFDFDFVPVVGWADDLAAAVIGVRALLRS